MASGWRLSAITLKPAATWRDAAYIAALERLSEAHEARGLWP